MIIKKPVTLIDTQKLILGLISKIPDPEIPVLTVADLGMIREVNVTEGQKIIVIITPTYSGCPATHRIESDILKTLADAGYDDVEIKMTYHPAWTTDWISDAAREKLRQYGIAPPQGKSSNKLSLFDETKKIPCPRCGTTDTIQISQHGSTACKALYRCGVCLEPFEYFKCL